MYTPNCDVFWVGSYPAKDPEKVCRGILKNTSMLLHWPQLPKRARVERVVDQTYAALSTPDDSFPKGAATGWNAMWRLLKKSKRRSKTGFFKTQIAGPITLFGKLQAGGIKYEQKLSEQVSLWLGHAYWQIDSIKENGFRPIVMLDEPLLPTYMGQASSARGKRTLKLLRSIVRRLKRRGAKVGIHCCNRISPATLIGLEVDLIHFDCFHFPTQTTQSRDTLREFLLRGGIIAWGVVPTAEVLNAASRTQVEKTLRDSIASMESRGLPLRRVLAQSMVAPTCGTGLLSSEKSAEIEEFTTSLSQALKSKYQL